jgi:hypothetical protein
VGGQDDEVGQQAVEPPDAPRLSAVAVPRRHAAEEILRRAVTGVNCGPASTAISPPTC